MSSWIEYTDPTWRNLQMRLLKVDEAYFSINSSSTIERNFIYTLSSECYECPYTKVKVISPNQTNEIFKLNVAHPLSFKIFDNDVGKYAPNNASAMCNLQNLDFNEFGVYNFSIYPNNSCVVLTDKAGVNVNKSLFLVILLAIILAIIYKLSNYITRRYQSSTVSDDVVNNADEAVVEKPVQKKRMRSLDAFRGLVMVLMIFVNSGGGGYWWIEHAPWNGLHLADIVFPCFLWIMGVCIPFSIKSQLSRGTTKLSICKKIIWRSVKMFLIGVCLNSINGPQLEDLRIMGVLQRFGIAFLVVGILHTIFFKTENVMPQSGLKRSIFDLILLKEQLISAVVLIVISLGITFGINAPGCPRGYLGPGGKYMNASNPNCIGGIVGFIDLKILGESHIYQHPTAKYLYDSKAFDPEGVFGCLLTIVQVFFGVICGTILTTHVHWIARIKRWLVWSILLGLLGGILCLFSKENGLIPINKNLWSLSFVLVTSSLAFLLLVILYYTIDVREIWSGFPFAECGMNAIVLYVGHTVFHKMLPWHWTVGPMNTHFMLLLKCIWNTVLWVGIALYLNGIKYYYTL
ncbi:heparan-alpha-glucosaminide N-acetyltransferase [Eupeodes corollae]|uniref:heparan-alpha-glucosaminide N-acetyltransferase n=1 Tax=Eupeodes corollae TaxID=290404 RepID=UPI002490EE9A|nr:heparan-alpha-glucosaminide N-acetyltransferase [Eupeodes corollae]XP_055915707.1 heparan-alpha-glucosaminide N-acetyltransferase [Eupeodes corollae]XP_055915708.1 heparan-alpha-glucosaminide N-acetyltransferase [Eupeodes corollae]XP_055915709.1 heparan-alpha-glucosaminide N-acetyltransferase [Eupeodes corollae]XP_055915710.1 heparan-alpha-glucosaminide N-acetyltransferase [Eupeodes corollae]